MTQTRGSFEKVRTGLSGFDEIAEGGLPSGRTTLVAGPVGSGKTIFCCQFLADGIMQANEAAVFVTFEELPADIRKNVASFGWDVARWEKDGRWVFVDATPHPEEDSVLVGEYDLGSMMARIEHAIRKVGAKRVCIDSFGALLTRFENPAFVSRQFLKVSAALRALGVTAVLTAEPTGDPGELSLHGIGQFMADNVVVLRNTLENERRRRTIEVLKIRGSTHRKGEFAFTVVPEKGLVVLPVPICDLDFASSLVRVGFGNATLDSMCGGGLYRDSSVLISGATGTGKTLLATEFVRGAVTTGGRALLFAFEESREQLLRNARGWGINLAEMESEGLLKVVCAYPEAASLEDHLISIRTLVDEFKPDRIAIDSLSALERSSTDRGYRDFFFGVNSFFKRCQITTLCTSTTPTLLGGPTIIESHISTITDLIILLRYVEIRGEMHRGIAILKMRGSEHEKSIREYAIDGHGMRIGLPFHGVSGILSGHPAQVAVDGAEPATEAFEGGARGRS
jgi:circadian clock protein KaiC